MAWLLGAVSPQTQASDTADLTWRFTVLLDGKPIGHHHVELMEHDTEVEYRSETRLEVKILFLTVFHYLHSDRESWRDDCLSSIESTTDDDGKAQFLKGARSTDAFTLSTAHGSTTLTADCVMTFAYWNPRILSAKQLLNAQTGEYVPVRVEALGADQVMVYGQPVSAERFAITGEQLRIELWYAQDRWVGLSTKTQSGGNLQYQLR